MRTLLLSLVSLTFTSAAHSQVACSPPATSAVELRLRTAQRLVLDLAASPMDSTVPPEAAPTLTRWKAAVADAVDAEISCSEISDSAPAIETRLAGFLGRAAPNPPKAAQRASDQDSDKPQQGVFGNNVSAHVQIFSGPPRLLQVTVDSTVPCGTDSQLLVYEPQDGRWRRALRWTSALQPENGTAHAWGDFFLSGILVPDPSQPEQWRAVVAHGTPWCTSRFSSFGLAVIAPVSGGDRARVLWQTDRAYSRFDFEPRLKVSADTFELRLHADEMAFNEDGFERLVVYRYRLNHDTLLRLEPIAANARGFVEEWLSAPWDEARAQSGETHATLLRPVQERFENSLKDPAGSLSWAAGPVQACSLAARFQVTFSTEQHTPAQGTPAGKDTPAPTYYFQVEQAPGGYRMLSVSQSSDPACTGADLMQHPPR